MRSPDELDAVHRQRLRAAIEWTEASGPSAHPALAALRAIDHAAVQRGTVRRRLLRLTADADPLAAVSLGDPRTADSVTLLVPGMATTALSMPIWTQGAVNVHREQGVVGGRRRCVIAWIGYRTPPRGLAATRDAHAAAGALRLLAELRWLRALRGGLDTVSVVGHSYGATMGALALARSDAPALAGDRLHAFVLLGAPGVDPRIRTASQLAARSVRVARASADLQARIGGLRRRDPLAAGFGARRIDVDAPGDPLAPVTGHAPVLHSPWSDNPNSARWTGIVDQGERARGYAMHMAAHGYLDPGTRSLREVAVATMIGADSSSTRP